MLNRTLSFVAVVAIALTVALPAAASCRIRNETKYSFTVESGNVSNQRVGSNTTTSIASGKILAKGDQGKSFGGHCKDGDSIAVKEKDGVVYLEHK